MVDWARLPKDILELISKSLESSFDLLKFRSVCSSWRAAAEPKRLLPTHEFSILPENDDIDNLFPDSALGFRLSQLSVLLIKPQEPADSIGWLVKVEQDFYNPRIHEREWEREHEVILVDPLSDDYMILPRHFPRVVDMSKFKVRELSREFSLHCFNTDGRSKYSLYHKKPLVKYLDGDAESKFVLLTIHDTDNLAVFTSSDQLWTVINDTTSDYFCDVILFNGCFFAVDKNGRTVVVDYSSFELTLAASPVSGGDKKFLIESCGELLLVDMYLGEEFDSISLWNFEEDDILENQGCFYNDITYKIKVFKLVERDKSWVEVKDLGDKLLFLGESTFSASASDILPLWGGSVFFRGFIFDCEDLERINQQNLGVCDFISGEIKLVRPHHECCKLFWPPPPWFTSPESQRAEDHTGEQSSQSQKTCLCNPNFKTLGRCYCNSG